MSFVFSFFVALELFLFLDTFQSCSVVQPNDFSPNIVDLFLNNANSDLLTVQIEGNSKSCRSLDTKTETLAFISISCDTKSYPWTDITTSSIISCDVRNASENNSLPTVFVKFPETSELEINIPYYIFPDYFAWFYSSNMATLFILTPDTSAINASEAALHNMTLAEYYDSEIGITADYSMNTTHLAVIFVAFNPNQTPKKDYRVDIKPWSTVFNAADNLVDTTKSWILGLEKPAIYNYDALYIVQFPVAVSSCGSHHPWFSYENSDLYDVIGNGSNVWSYEFKYIGSGYSGADDRKSRVYGYSTSDVWWYDVGTAGKGSYFSMSFTSDNLTNWWFLMWIVVGSFICCICLCCCICCIRKRRQRKESRNRHFNAAV